MIAIKKARKLVAIHTAGLGRERVPIEMSLGRVLAEPIRADRDQPPFDRSTMDGFAFARSSFGRQKAEDRPLLVVGESAAGSPFAGRLRPGEAVRIMTGAAVPSGADTVIRQEDTSVEGDLVRLARIPDLGSSIVKRGTDARKGSLVITRGEIINEFNSVPIAAFGYSSVIVAKLPKVTIIPTGSEIVGIADTPSATQIRDSNSSMLIGMLGRFGIRPRIAGRRADEIRSITDAIRRAAVKSDIVMLTGGVSVGKYDHTTEAIKRAGGEVLFERVRMKPGKPTVFAKIGHTLVFGLPGNPLSAMVAFRIFVADAIKRMLGTKHRDKFFPAVAGTRIVAARARDTFVPCSLIISGSGSLIASPIRSSGSGDITAIANADCFAVLRAGNVVEAGCLVETIWLDAFDPTI